MCENRSAHEHPGMCLFLPIYCCEKNIRVYINVADTPPAHVFGFQSLLKELGINICGIESRRIGIPHEFDKI